MTPFDKHTVAIVALISACAALAGFLFVGSLLDLPGGSLDPMEALLQLPAWLAGGGVMHANALAPLAGMLAACAIWGIWVHQALRGGTFRLGEEHGSSRWGSIEEGKAFMNQDEPDLNIPLTSSIGIPVSRSDFDLETDRNRNICVVGTPGTGKTRSHVLPLLMQMNASYLVTDPKGTLIESTGWMFEADGTHVVEIAFDGTGLGGKSLVVYEKLFSADVQLASHEDPSDEGQTVTVVEIGTTLVDAIDGDHVIVSSKVKLTDTIEYKGLVPGETYTAHGTLMVKSTGLALEDADGKPVTATAEFTPDKPSGTVDVTFEFDASKIEEGVELVAFEECLDVNGNVIAVHQDIEDDGQTVVVDNPDTPKAPDEPGKGYDKTGFDTTMLFAAVVILIAAGAACGIYAIRKRKQASIESDEDADSETDES